MDYLQEFINRYPHLESIKKEIFLVYEMIKKSYMEGGKLLIAGNGGSASDAEHIAGELMKTFKKKRTLPESFIDEIKNVNNEISDYIVPRLQPGLPAIALSGHASLNTACINDIDGNITFAQQVYCYGKKEDILLAITTSGNSKNILYAASVAKAKKMQVAALTGKDGGKIRQLADVCICVPETETYKIQELHLPVYHIICMMLEDFFF